MTTETRKRIRAYKKMLPELRERVIAVALLLAMSASMLGSASFAWLTLSRRPEVTGVSTTIASNGNLEIALATGTAMNPNVPNESAVGDSSAAQGQSVTASNITWGNLVNLSDPSYGLDNLTLRPAQLNRSALLINPLYGASYKGDGRVEKLNSDFGFATWQTNENGNKYFGISDNIGVRAISSVTVEAVGFAEQVYNKRKVADEKNLEAGSAYDAIIKNGDYMATLATVMGTYMTAELNPDDASLSNPKMNQKDIKNLRDIFNDFVQVYNIQYEAMAALINYQQFLLNNSETSTNPYTDITAEDLKTRYTSEALLKNDVNKNIELTQMTLNKKAVDTLTQMKNDYTALVAGYQQLAALYDQGSVKWQDSGLNAIVDSLMSTGACTLDGTPIGNIGASNALGYLDGQTHNAVITNGVLYNFEYLNGANRCDVRGLKVSAKYIITVSISANITTNAPSPSIFFTDLSYSDTLNQGAQGVAVAQDTYGLALDLWVRTNAPSSYLTLEGNVLTTSEWVQATGTDINGNPVDIYTISRTEESDSDSDIPLSYSIDLYKVVTKANDGTETEVWYNADTHATFTLEEGEIPKLKSVELITVVGYEGENRIWEDANAWEDNSQLSLDSTTQGSGSCYVYYADTPEDQARSLELLKAMNVAFVSGDGNLLATAEMDTSRYYAENGRVTVPLMLSSDSTQIGTDDDGNPIYGITMLQKNTPTRITAIVFLDGTKLNNEHVLAASDIQGKLNIQFGSSVTLSHAEDEVLFGSIRTVSATVDKSEHSYDDYKGNGNPMRSTVTLIVDGEAPKTVTGFFIRTISPTQGSREKLMTFTNPSGDGVTWIATYDFDTPGNYVLRSVELDGQTYDLATRPEVNIEGFSVSSLAYTSSGTEAGNTNNHVSIMTDASSYTVGLRLGFASDKVEAMPSTVQGRFLREDGTAVNINFTYNTNGSEKGYWTGNATFLASGEYALQYLVLDGEYTELDPALQKTATVKLGMKAAVYTTSPVQFKYVPSELTDNQENLYMQVVIMDNSGTPLQGLQNVHLYYAMQGSTVDGFDTPLTWNGSSGYYEGTFHSDVGVYYFDYITVGSNTITYAETSPRFTIQSPNPPTYKEIVPLSYVYNPAANTNMQVKMTYSSTATVAAVIRNLGDNKTYEVQGRIATDDKVNNEQIWSFLIPVTGEGNDAKQDGNWQLETIRVWNYYDAAGNYVRAEVDKDGNLTTETEENRDDPLEFAVRNHVTKAVTKVYTTVSDIADAELGKDGNTVTGKFMDTYTISGLSVKVEDFEHQEIQGLNSVTLKYVYGNNSSTYGYYTSKDNTLNNEKADFTVKLTKNGTMYTQAEDVTVQYAGTYAPVLTAQTNMGNISIDADNIAFAIHSSKPSLTVASASTNNGAWAMNGTKFTAHTGSGKTKNDVTQVQNTYNADTNVLNVYISAVYRDSAIALGQGKGLWYNTTTSGTGGLIDSESNVQNRSVPKIVLTLSNTGKTFSSATIACAGDNGLNLNATINRGNSESETFNTSSMTIGNVSGGLKIFNYGVCCNARTLFGTGKIISTITMTDANGAEYTVTLAKPLTINNPA